MAVANNDELNEEIKKLLRGDSSSVTASSFYHVLRTSTEKEDHSLSTNDFQPVLMRNFCLVVAAVIFNDKNEVLMTQEGFFPHVGEWYLPAGRVDPNETLVEAVRREVREETGLEMEPTSLIAVEAPDIRWYRFTFTGHITGGRLRTLKEKDDETMQGGWWNVDMVLSAQKRGNRDPLKCFVLRGRDIIKLIQLGHIFHSKPEAETHPCILPVANKHSRILVQPLILCQHKGEVKLLLTCVDGEVKFPVMVMDTKFPSVVDRVLHYLKEVHGKHTDVTLISSGILAFEYEGIHGKYDGICLSLKIVVELSSTKEPCTTTNSVWYSLTDKVLAKQCMSQGSVAFLYR